MWLRCNYHLVRKGCGAYGPNQIYFGKYYKLHYKPVKMLYVNGYIHGWTLIVSLNQSISIQNTCFKITFICHTFIIYVDPLNFQGKILGSLKLYSSSILLSLFMRRSIQHTNQNRNIFDEVNGYDVQKIPNGSNPNHALKYKTKSVKSWS